MILSVETATDKSSVALHVEGQLLGLTELHLEKSHSGHLTVIIEQLMTSCSVSKNSIDAVAVSVGPGSYTGLRIGISTAKGICYALNKPLIAVDSLEIMAEQVMNNYLGMSNKKQLFCPMIDARRMEVYTSLYNISKTCMLKPKSVIVEANTLSEFTSEYEIIIFGNGARKCLQVLPESSFKYIASIYPSAKYLGGLAYKKFQNNEFADLAYLEPFYLKAYQAKLPKRNKLFN